MLESYLKAIPIFPLIALLTNLFLIRYRFKVITYGLVSFIGVFIPFVLLSYLGTQLNSIHFVEVTFWKWLLINDSTINLSLYLDNLSLPLSLVVSGIGSLITLFAIGYMEEDESPGRFFCYISLFIFFMLLLVLAENWLVLFFGWEGVGLCSYLLIGFWYEDWDKALAGKKALIVNRIGDVGIILGMLGFYFIFNSFSFLSLKNLDPTLISSNYNLAVFSTLAIVLGVAGKSAQMPLYIWLPDAMAGPTPVSALIHAATMVTAGIFLLCRISFLLIHVPIVLEVISWMGALTALMGAVMALTQSDIKKILAYSTVSQLGFMVLACGVGSFSSAMFHVITHAFFKALLFLSAGAIIYILHHQQDIFKMGGLRKSSPLIFWCFLIGFLCIIGIPGFSGFFSKDEILWAVLNKPSNGKHLYVISLTTALLTAFYMTRLFLNVFILPSKAGKNKHEAHKLPIIMSAPLIILSIGSVLIGMLGLPHYLTHENSFLLQSFIKQALPPEPEATLSTGTEYMAIGWTVFGTLLSSFLAYFIYCIKAKNEMSEILKEKFLFLWNLTNRKLYVDEAYKIIFVNPLLKLSEVTNLFIEKHVTDGAVVGIASLFYRSSVLLISLRPSKLDGNLLYFISGATFVLITLFYFLVFK